MPNDIKVLEEVRPKIYKVKGISENTNLNSKKLLENPDWLRCTIKVCDGSYHIINSELKELLEKNKGLVKKGFYTEIVASVCPSESMRSHRFIIWHPKDSDIAYLLGDVETALKKLANK